MRLEVHNPFLPNNLLKSLSTGIIGNDSINCYLAKEKGEIGIDQMEDKIYKDLSLKRKDRILSLAAVNSSIKVNNQVIVVDPLVLFTRMLAAKKNDDDLVDYFTYELSPHPMAIFTEHGMRKNKKSSLYDVFTTLHENVLSSNDVYVVDGGYLLHKVKWHINTTYKDICASYVKYVQSHYGQSIIVFDGYENPESTKRFEQQRRYEKSKCPEFVFDENMKATVTQEQFLSNDKNKIRLISILKTFFEKAGCAVYIAEDDADLLIINKAIQKSSNIQVTVVGEDVDLLVLLIALTPENKNIYFLKPGSGKIAKKVFSSNDLQKQYFNIKNTILLAHAFSGCDSTSAIFRKGKLKILKIMEKYQTIITNIAATFKNVDATSSQIEKAGETLFILLYSSQSTNVTLDELRVTEFKKSLKKILLNWNHCLQLLMLLHNIHSEYIIKFRPGLVIKKTQRIGDVKNWMAVSFR